MTNTEKAVIFGASTLAGLLVVSALFCNVERREEPVTEPVQSPVEQTAPDETGAPPVDSGKPLPVEDVPTGEDGDLFPEEREVSPELVGPVPTPPEPEGEQSQREVTLFFQAPHGEELMPEERFIFETDSISDQARQVVRELIKGPATDLLPTLPASTELREVYLTEGGTTYVDLSQSFIDDHPGGSAAEIGTVFSLVDTLVFNFDDIERVKILVEGEERPTLKEHLDLSRTYVADWSIVGSMDH